MGLRFNTLLSVYRSRIVKKTSLFLLVLISCPAFSQKTTLDDVKKEADKLFEDDEFTKAYNLYAQLVSNYPKDPEYNYRLGVCMIYSEPDKKKCISYLKFAAANPKDAPKDVNFYLGKAYHINYRFDEAIKYYIEYKKIGSSAKQKKLQVDREIKACSNGKKLLSDLSDLEVQNKKELNEVDYFRSYDLKTIGGKLLVKPDDFKTPTDKKKKDKSVVFLPKGSNVVYYSSYGDNTETGKDIYTISKQANGEFAKPNKVQGINTEFDEDYPFLHPDGRTLYFASKGHNSMGGYDIFKSTFNEETNSWGQPINLEFPINSPDDDFLFVTDSLEKTAYFSTGRQSPPGKIDVLKINTERKPIDVLVIKGTVMKGSEDQSLKSVVTVKNTADDSRVGVFSAEDNGSYDMELPNGAKLLFTVETPGLKTQSEEVDLPLATKSKPYKQTIAYADGILKILNQFDENGNEDSYLQYLKVIEKKAKLDVNEGQNKLTPSTPTNVVAVVDSSKSTVKPNKNVRPQIIEQEESSIDAVKTNTVEAPSVNNKQLAEMAKNDADELRQEAIQLKRDAKDALETGQKQKEQADKKLTEANETLKNADTIRDDETKATEITKANNLKKSAENEQIIATKILDYAKSLNEDANNKQKEADLNEAYAKELNNSLTIKNKKESISKLEEIQKQINNSPPNKNKSDDVITSIKNDIDQKDKQIAQTEKINSDIKINLDEIKNEITNKEADLSKTRKKDAKALIANQINNLKTEQAEKEKQIATNEEEIKSLNEDLMSLKNGLEITNRIKAEDVDIAVNSNTNILQPSTPIENNLPIKNDKISDIKTGTKTDLTLQEKYKDKIIISDPSNKSGIEESTRQLKNFNKEIDQTITSDKTALAKAKKPAEKQKITNEIKSLENLKKQNQQQITSNTNLLKELDRNQIPPVGDEATSIEPIAAGNSAEAITKLDKLNNQLAVNDNENFDFNGYQNPNAQNLKIEADAKINEAIARQKKLKEDIANSKETIQNNPSSPATNVNIDQLNKEAEESHAKSLQLINEAKTKEGADKEKTLNEARNLDDLANDKYIQVAEVAKRDNTASYETNKENIQNLINENKSQEPDLGEVKKLNEEANLAFKQATEMRNEALTATNKGAKLGSLSNAEEKEAEALLKQQQAVDLLKKNSPDFVLKTPVTSSSKQNSSDGPASLETQLDAVNKGVKELAAIKIDSYQKLAEANDLEIEQISTNLRNNQAALDKTPRFKTDFISATNKLETAKKLKQNSESSANSGDKLSKLIASIKKQNEAIKQLNSLNIAVTQVAENPKEVTNNTPVPNENSLPDNGANNSVGNNNPAKNNETKNPVVANSKNENPQEPNVKNTETEKNSPTDPIVNTTAFKNDSTTAQVLSLLENNTTPLKNPQANNLLKNSLAQLKNYENENSEIDKQLNGSPSPANPNVSMSLDQLKGRSDSLVTEADQLANEAAKTKREAEDKTGEEKDNLLAKAKELENKSLEKSIEAANMALQANEKEAKNNAVVIKELLGKVKTDNPTLGGDLEQKNTEIKTLENQTDQLRKEADALTNKAARLGAYSNAEEQEALLLQKQNELLSELKKQYPDYVVKSNLENNANEVENKATPEELTIKKKQILEKQFAELTNLTNAFSLEFETVKNSVPKNLSRGQLETKQKADQLSNESRRLLIKSASVKDENEKMKLLTLAASTGNAALEELNKLAPAVTASNNAPTKELENIGNRIEESNTAKPATTLKKNNKPKDNVTEKKAVTPVATANNNRTTVKIEGLEVLRGNAYSDAKPIPVDAKIEDGLVFRVQIGAFRSLLPNNAFKGLSPLNGERTPSGYFRYTAGNFNKIENANAVKNDLRGLGYSDAFVVAYYNGKRISVNEALDLMNKEGKTIDPNASQTAGITSNINVPKASANPVISEKVEVSKELEKVNGLLFTVQIGVYNKQISKRELFNLRPIFTEQLGNGLYRYTAGIYNNTDKIINDKRKVIDLGVKDAFVSAYINGKKVAFAEAKNRQTTDSTIKMEAEDPIVFPTGTIGNASPVGVNNPAVTFPVNANPVKPFSNGVSAYPAATAENGVKQTEEGICFKVQIGAYSKQVPNEVANKFSAIKNWPIENKQANTLFIYNIGNFSEARFAKTLKDEVVRLGINDAFITVYKDGKKLYGTEASGYMK